MTEYSLMYKTISSDDGLPVSENDIRETLEKLYSFETSDVLDDLTELDWESWNEDMLLISDKFPNVLFNLMIYNHPESSLVYYFNGKRYENYPMDVIG